MFEKEKKNKVFILGTICIFISILTFWAFYNGLVVRKYTITTDKLGKNESIRIVLISDLHSSIYGDGQRDIITLIKKQKPDIIALAGDIADDIMPIVGTQMFLEGINSIAPIYYVSGNHEFWSGDIKDIKATIRQYDVKILENSYEEFRLNGSNIIIGGVDDPDIVSYEKPDFKWYEEMENAFTVLKDKSDFKILLSHRPELVETYEKSGFDLVLSGHAHGGQVRIPLLLNGLLAPNQGWFPKYAGGLYKHATFTHIVSRGVSYNPRLPRIFNPPEVVVIDIVGSRASK